MKSKLIYFLNLVVLILIIASIPQSFNYQGKILDSLGIGVNDTLPMTFRLFTGETGGEYLWQRTSPVVIISKGLFSVELSDFPDTVDFSNQYYLEIEVDGETLLPREKLTSVPYAIRADKVSNAIQSVVSDSNATERTGRFNFRAGEGATLEDDGSNINITIGTCAGGTTGTIPSIYDVLISGDNAGGYGIHNLANPEAPQDVATKAYVDDHSVSSISGGNALTPDGPSQGITTLNVSVDDTTIGIALDALYVKNSGITSTQIAMDAVTSEEIITEGVTTDEIANGTIITEDVNSIDWSKIDKTVSSIDDIADVTITTPTMGDIAYFDGSNWINMGAGNVGQVLTTQGITSPPIWETPAALAIFNFLLSVSPSSDGVEAGDNVLASVKVTGISGEEQNVDFHTIDLPSGVSTSFVPTGCAPTSPTGNCTSTMTVFTSESSPRGTYPITITGISDGGSQSTATYNITIATVPGAISDLTATVDDGDVVLNWTAPSDNGGSLITNYIIYRGTSPNPTDSLGSVGSVLTYTDTSVLLNEIYYYRISAVNAIGEGVISGDVEVNLLYPIGGTITTVTDGGIDYRIHTYTSVGNQTFTVNYSMDVEVLIVGGGASGQTGHATGGGGGQVKYNSSLPVTPQTYSIIVGDGGNSAGNGTNGAGNPGQNSSALGITANGGLVNGNGPEGAPAGSQGLGAGGTNGSRQGGNGSTNSITSSSIYYGGGGGGGGGASYETSPGGTGGLGGGGHGGSCCDLDTATPGDENSGGGGGAGGISWCGTVYCAGKDGGSGIVIIRYPI